MNRLSRLCVLVLAVSLFLSIVPAEAQVNYRVTGILKVVSHQQGTFAVLRTGDGRVFNLIGFDAAKIWSFDGQNVVVEGAAKQADQVLDLKVTHIAVAPIEREALVLPPFKAHQTPPKLIAQNAPMYKVKDVRWGYIPNQPRTNENFRYLNTIIDTSKVDRAFFVLKPFPPEWIAAHSLLFFSFRKGGVVNEQGEESAGLFLSIEAYQRTNQSYSLTEGLKKAFGVSWILATWEDYTAQSCEVQQERLFMYPLKLSQGQLSALAAECILQATQNRAGEYYHTVTNNCTNNLIVLLNRVLPEPQRINLWWIPSMVYNMRATTPVVVPKMLMKRGLLDEALPEVNAANCRNIFALPSAFEAMPPVRSGER